MPLVVDAAWAAHLGFHPDLPPHALAAGADAMVTSAHKALPAYTQAALVLARTERLDPARLHRAFEATHTTSPAGSIMASIDAARALLAARRRAALRRAAGERGRGPAAAGRRCRAWPCSTGPGVEPTKLVILLAGTGAHGYAVENDLVARRACRSRWRTGTRSSRSSRWPTTRPRWTAGSPSSIAIVDRHRGTPRHPAPAAAWTVEPQTVLAPREAFFAANETVPAAEAVGRVSAELVAPYPPGVPVLAPGELITAAALDALREVRDDGGRIAYAADPTPGHLPGRHHEPGATPALSPLRCRLTGCRAGGGAGLEQGSFALVAGESGGAAELLAGLIEAAELGQEVTADRGKLGVGREGRLCGQLVGDLEPAGGAVRHADGDGPVQLDDR